MIRITVRQIISRWGILFILLGAASLASAGEDSFGLEEYAAAWKHYARVVSGRFQIHGAFRQFGPAGAVFSREASYNITISGTRIRFEVDAEHLITGDEGQLAMLSGPDQADRIGESLSSGSLRKERQRLLYVETEAQNYLYLDDGRQLQIKTNPRSAKSAVEFFDPRTLGLAGAPRPETVANKSIEIISSAIQSLSGRNAIRVEFLNKDSVRTIVWLDEESRLVTRIEGAAPLAQANTVTEIEYRLDPASSILVQQMATTRNYEGTRLISERVWTVAKSEINMPIDPEEFIPERFHMARNTTVFDDSNQRLVALWNGEAFVRPGKPDLDPATMDFIHGSTTKPAQ
ncbi:MAG: hypothetical protein HY718_22060 [Planctomycetes bacterium]|nr:hypothetical protein [Planctomycetota bacterium]